MTAAAFGVDLYQKLREPQLAGGHDYSSRSGHTRPTSSGHPPSAPEDYSPPGGGGQLPYPLSRFDSSGNENNKRLSSFHSSRYSRSNSNSEHSSTWTSSTGANNHNLPASSLLRNEGMRGSNGSLSTSKALDDAMEKCGDVMIEEKRRRPHGDGFTVHRYIRGRLLGKGGFAKVYLCTACDTDKAYAVKVVPKANLVKARARQKLQAEIKIHRTLKHPHICQYKHYFEDRENCYILLELCQNQTLNEMLKRRKRLTEPETAYFLRQLLDAVRHMHDELIIHRDLKLGNLFLDSDMIVKVGDFGLATRVEDRDEKRKTICGTPNYIAPEIIQGDKSKRGHSFEVDVWSIGVILYTLLVGKPPYEAKDVKATYQRILANEYSFPGHVDLSSDAKSVIVSMLKSDPAERPSLDQIESHRFFTSNIIPDSLTTNVLCMAPQWIVSETGHLVTEQEQSAKHTSSKLSQARTASGRLPFLTRDPNMAKPPSTTSHARPEKAGREVIDIHRIASNAATLSGMKAKPPNVPAPSSHTPAFTIFDESRGPRNSESRSVAASKPPQPRSSTFSDDALVQRTKSLTVGSPTRTASTVSSTFSSQDSDMEILRKMVEQLETVLNITDNRVGMYRGQVPRRLSGRSGPAKWVVRYVDYTSKYGLGFLLNDGSSGVYFNDSTKAALEAEGENFQYIERRKPEDVDPVNRRFENQTSTHSLMSYPESLKKKVTLLTHFRNYLMEQQKKADEEESMPSSINAISSESLVYVKKWVRTKHAILFRLSDQTVQVVFYDQTEILMTPDLRYVTYIDKARYRATYAFTDELVGSWSEMGKRLKYSKEIILQLLTGSRK